MDGLIVRQEDGEEGGGKGIEGLPATHLNPKSLAGSHKLIARHRATAVRVEALTTSTEDSEVADKGGGEGEGG